MPRLRALETILHGVGPDLFRFAPGETFDCPEAGVAQLLALGSAELAPEAPPAPVEPPAKPAKPGKG